MRVENVQLSGPKSSEAACTCFGRFRSNFGHEIGLRFRNCKRSLWMSGLFTIKCVVLQQEAKYQINSEYLKIIHYMTIETFSLL